MPQIDAAKDIKIADFSWVGVGPLVSQYLAQHGATVVKIESSLAPDFVRVAVPYKDGIPGLNRSFIPPEFMSNKYGVTLNLRHARAKSVVKRLVEWADIVLESFAPGTAARLGFGYEELRKTKENIIMLSASIQGQKGKYSGNPGYGYHSVALCGFADLTGWPDREPAGVYSVYTDLVTPLFGIVGVMAALDYRHRTGKGQYIDLSQVESSLTFLAPGLLDCAVNNRIPSCKGNRDNWAVPHGVFRCKGDDRWCAITVFTEEEWRALCEQMDNPTWTKEPRFGTFLSRKQNEDELEKLLETWTIQFDPEELMNKLQKAGVPAGAVRSVKDLHDDPQLKHFHHFVELDHPEIGSHFVSAPSFKLSKTPGYHRFRYPCLGQHNEYVYTKLLGMSDQEFIEMLNEGVFE